LKPNLKFSKKPKSFWASVRTLSQHLGYSKGNTIITPTPTQMAQAFEKLGLNATKLIADEKPTELALELANYFRHRAKILENHVEPKLMNKVRAKRNSRSFGQH